MERKGNLTDFIIRLASFGRCVIGAVHSGELH